MILIKCPHWSSTISTNLFNGNLFWLHLFCGFSNITTLSKFWSRCLLINVTLSFLNTTLSFLIIITLVRLLQLWAFCNFFLLKYPLCQHIRCVSHHSHTQSIVSTFTLFFISDPSQWSLPCRPLSDFRIELLPMQTYSWTAVSAAPFISSTWHFFSTSANSGHTPFMQTSNPPILVSTVVFQKDIYHLISCLLTQTFPLQLSQRKEAVSTGLSCLSIHILS